jgi:hypothetical protein
MTLNINIDRLLLIQKAMGLRLRAQVGVLGNSQHNRSVIKPRMDTVRNDKGIDRPSKTLGSNKTNAEIGAEHEFGSMTRHLPKRSFLWMPLSFHLFEYVQKKSSVFNNLINQGNVAGCYTMLGIVGETVVKDAFRTGGFDNWPQLSPVTIEKKGSDKILIDTTQLRNSCTSRIV